MSDPEDVECELDDAAPARAIQEAVVDRMVDKAFSGTLIASCYRNQICIVVDAPNERWAGLLTGLIAGRFRGKRVGKGGSRCEAPSPYVFRRSPPAKSRSLTEDRDAERVLLSIRQGRSIIAVMSAASEALPIITDALDMRIRIARPDPADIAHAFRQATGIPVDPADFVAVDGLDLEALAMIARPRTDLDQTRERLRAKRFGPIDKTDDEVPDLHQMAGYGEARDWALSALQLLERLRSGDPAVRLSDLPRGLLLVGPPGVGKSVFARSLSKTLRVPAVITSASEWLSAGDAHLGSTLQALRRSVEQASAYQPGILFIDEVDSIVDRDMEGSKSASWWLNFVNGVLTAIDGAIKTPGLITVGACNNDRRVDKALKRSGRLEKVVHIGLPDVEDRLAILEFYVRGDLQRSVLRACAVRASGKSGADLARAVREARKTAGNEKRELTPRDLMQAIAPPPRLSGADLNVIAIHEAGHAVVSLLAGLSVESVDIERAETRINHADRLIDGASVDQILVSLLAGRAADEIIGSGANSGAGGSANSDLARATALAVARHETYGLAGSLVWTTQIEDAVKRLAADLDLRLKVHSDLQAAYARALEMTGRNERMVRLVATELLARRFMTGEEILELITSPATSLG